VPVLPSDAGERRLRAERVSSEAQRDLERLRQEISDLEARREALGDATELASIDEQLVETLQRQLALHLAALTERPQLAGALAELEQDVAALLRELGAQVEPADAERLRVDAATVARVEELAEQRGACEAQLRAAEQQRDERRAELDQLQRQLDSCPAAHDPRSLAVAVTRAQRDGDLDEALRELSQQLQRLREQGSQLAEALAIDPQQHVAAALPSMATIERHEQALREADQQGRQQLQRGDELAERLRACRRELRALEQQGELPSEEALSEARLARDTTWRELREHGRVTKERAEQMEQAIEQADHTADRMWREAERVAQRAQLTAEREELEHAIEANEREAIKSREEHAALDERWRDSWRASGVEPRDPSHMRGWLERQRQWQQLAQQQAELSGRLDATRQRHADHVERLERELTQLAQGEARQRDSLRELLDGAEIVVDELEEAVRARRQLEQAVQQQSQSLEQSEVEHRARREAFDAWRSGWCKAMGRAGMPEATSIGEARSILSLRGRLFEKLGAAESVRGRLDTMGDDAKRFEDEVRRMATPHQLQDETLTAAELADRFVQAHRAAREAASQREQLNRDLRQREAAVSEAAERATAGRDELDELMRAARVDDRLALVAAEQKVAEAGALDKQLREVEDELFAAGEGAGLDELKALAADIDVDAVKTRLDEINERSDAVNERNDELSRDIGSLQHTLQRHFEDRPGAHDASDEAQARLATVGRLARRYASLRLGIALLEKEIERYRRENQGPILRRAGELFPELTLGRFRELSVELGERDKAELRCVRVDGKELGVEELSDGTRDQLYLALRLASMERYGERSGPMPLVLDDVLIHFDDDRARAALDVLIRFARNNQVLFFTHHARLRDLARDASGGHLQEHELQARPLERRSTIALS
jgi:uncharacterized protein YhaN